MSDAALAATLEILANDTSDPVTDEQLQALFANVVRCYSTRAAERRLDIFPPTSDITATEVMITATAMLRAVDVQLFELGMWQTFSGARSE